MEAKDARPTLSARDIEAFAHVYDRHAKRIHRYVRSRVANENDVEDLSAHIFFRALTSISQFRGEGTHKAWLFRIARNVIADWYARRDREVPVEVFPDEAEEADGTPLALTLVDEENSLVREKVAQLSEAQQEVLRLHYWKGLSIEEIATRTRRSSVAVRQLLHRARRQLKGTLARKDVTVLLGATGASAAALAARSYRKHRKGER